MKIRFLKRFTAGIMCAATVWTLVCSANTASLAETVQAMLQQVNLPKSLLQWELSDFWGTDDLSLATVFSIRQSPTLLSARTLIAQPDTTQDPDDAPPAADTEPSPAPEKETTPKSEDSSSNATSLQFKDNGMPSQTVIPRTTKGFTMVNGVYIKNGTGIPISAKQLLKKDPAAKLSDDGPQVLIIHAHGSEAYTMPKGEAYKATGTCRTSNTKYNMVRIGDEVACVLSSYGISVLHDRTLYDSPDYNVAYERSGAAIENYLKKYPSICFVLDIHRDAIEDINGRQYKLVAKEDANAAQVSLVMGNDFDTWQDNLRLAVAVQKTLMDEHPTLMRPITMRNYRYNQHLCTGSMLVEIGAAGNSLDESLYAAQWFAQGLAETLLQYADQ